MVIEALYSIPPPVVAPPVHHGLLTGDLLPAVFALLSALVPWMLWRFRFVLAPYWHDLSRAHAWLCRRVRAALGSFLGALTCVGMVSTVEPLWRPSGVLMRYSTREHSRGGWANAP
jgi:hypothetical protein